MCNVIAAVLHLAIDISRIGKWGVTTHYIFENNKNTFHAMFTKISIHLPKLGALARRQICINYRKFGNAHMAVFSLNGYNLITRYEYDA